MTLVTGTSPSASHPDESLGAPIETALRLIGGRLKPDILICLGRGVTRFSELRRGIVGASDRALARQLGDLVRDGLAARAVYAETPVRIEYSLTPLGATLCPLLKQLWRWGDGYRAARVAGDGAANAHAGDVA